MTLKYLNSSNAKIKLLPWNLVDSGFVLVQTSLSNKFSSNTLLNNSSFFEYRKYFTGITIANNKTGQLKNIGAFAVPEGMTGTGNDGLWARWTTAYAHRVIMPRTYSAMAIGLCQNGSFNTYIVLLREEGVVTGLSNSNNIRGAIYVPDELFEDYKTSYSGLASRIKSLSDFYVDYPNDAKWI